MAVNGLGTVEDGAATVFGVEDLDLAKCVWSQFMSNAFGVVAEDLEAFQYLATVGTALGVVADLGTTAFGVVGVTAFGVVGVTAFGVVCVTAFGVVADLGTTAFGVVDVGVTPFVVVDVGETAFGVVEDLGTTAFGVGVTSFGVGVTSFGVVGVVNGGTGPPYNSVANLKSLEQTDSSSSTLAVTDSAFRVDLLLPVDTIKEPFVIATFDELAGTAFDGVGVGVDEGVAALDGVGVAAFDGVVEDVTACAGSLSKKFARLILLLL